MKTKHVYQYLLIQFLILPIIILNVGCADNSSASGSPTSSQTTGKAGSQARFSIIGDYLYTISDSRNLSLYHLQDPSAPAPWVTIPINFGIETLFAYQKHLFIGAVDGVYIYDNSNPAFPLQVSKLVHLRSCDPVVVQGNYAFVTLRGGTNCGGFNNQLDIIDISDIQNPQLKISYPMSAPKGLGIDGQYLFVCDGSTGLKIFDATDPLNLQTLELIPHLNCFDVIPYNNTLIVSDEFGILQYDYSNSPVELLSEIIIDE